MTSASEQPATVDPAPEAQSEEEAEGELMSDWQTLSNRSLWEHWDNESDSVYDTL